MDSLVEAPVVLPQLTLLTPDLMDCVCVFWAMVLCPKPWLCVENGSELPVLRVNGGVYKAFLWDLKKSGDVASFCGNHYPIIFMPGR